ncbi:MAG: hypothetical protein QG589_150 [Patescibacteria group bacterium]|nr:hypothetical protein [Patescibacteria group bacterium]
MEEKIKNLLLSWDEYNQKRFSVPYVYSIKNMNQELLCVGSRHCYDPKDNEFEIIKKEWDDFYKRNQGKEMIVVVEGGVTSIEKSEEEAIVKGGEMSFVTFLANESGVSTICLEPQRGKIFNEIAKKHGRDKTFYQRMAQVMLQWNTYTEKPELEKYLEYFMEKDKKESQWSDFDFSIDNMKRIHQGFFNTDFNPRDRKFFYDIIDPSQKKTVINQISRDENVVRDTAIVKGIIEEWQKGKSVFAIHGSGHAVIQEKSLRTLLI